VKRRVAFQFSLQSKELGKAATEGILNIKINRCRRKETANPCKLADLLRQETDEQNPLSTSMICKKLGEMGISCERRTLTKDIAVLNELGYEVMWVWVGKANGYCIEDRSFSVPELKILIDAVQAASFITDKKTAELIDKIAELGGSDKAEILKSNMVCSNTRKHSNEWIYYRSLALPGYNHIYFGILERNHKVLSVIVEVHQNSGVKQKKEKRFWLKPVLFFRSHLPDR
jgi:hypothetical protein